MRNWLNFDKSGLTNNKILEQHYSAIEVDALQKSYFCAISSDAVLDGKDESRYLFRSKFANEISSYALFSKIVDLHTQSFFLIDMVYQSLLSPLELRPCAIYGCGDIAIPPYLMALRPSNYLRVRHRRIPCFLAYDASFLVEIAEAVLQDYPNRKIAFRGQTREYTLSREPLVKQFLFGSDDAREPSLLATAVRAEFPYELWYHYWYLDILNLALKYNKELSDVLLDEWKFYHMSGRWELFLMAAAQHYGIPTYGLDLTTDLEIAIWFALFQGRTQSNQGELCYTPRFWYGRNHEDWPVVYFFSVDEDIPDEKSFFGVLNIDALRPRVQKALFEFGSWGLHINQPAEHLVAAAYLAPEFDCNPVAPVQMIFPPPQRDIFYTELLRLRETRIGHPSRNLYRHVFQLGYTN